MINWWTKTNRCVMDQQWWAEVTRTKWSFRPTAIKQMYRKIDPTVNIQIKKKLYIGNVTCRVN